MAPCFCGTKTRFGGFHSVVAHWLTLPCSQCSISFSRGSSRPSDRTRISCIGRWACVPGGQSARVEEWEPEQIMVQGSHMLTQGPCPIARKQQPSWNAAQRLPSPTWHLIVSVDCVKYQHSVNQAPFSENLEKERKNASLFLLT